MNHITLNGKTYDVRKMPVDGGPHNAWELHRRLAQAAPQLLNVVAMATEGQQTQAIAMAVSVGQAISSLSRVDADFIKHCCLSFVFRVEDNGDAAKTPICQNGVITYSDIGVMDIDKLIFASIRENLYDFLSELATTLKPGQVNS